MKKAVLLCICVLLFMCSCSSNHSKDVYFVHTAAFFQSGDGISISAVMEKQSAKGDEEYFVVSESGKTLGDAIKNMSDEYRECYFATCEIYIIDENADGIFLEKMTELCESPFLVSYARTVCVKETDRENVLESIKEEKHLKELLKQTKNGKVSFIHFLALCLSDGKSVKIPILSLNDNTEPAVTGNRIFNDSSSSDAAKKELLQHENLI